MSYFIIFFEQRPRQFNQMRPYSSIFVSSPLGPYLFGPGLSILPIVVAPLPVEQPFWATVIASSRGFCFFGGVFKTYCLTSSTSSTCSTVSTGSTGLHRRAHRTHDCHKHDTRYVETRITKHTTERKNTSKRKNHHRYSLNFPSISKYDSRCLWPATFSRQTMVAASSLPVHSATK